MKNLLPPFLLIISLATAKASSAQTTYTITANSTYTENKIPSQCTNCNINIAKGVTLTIDQDIYLQNVAFAGDAERGSAIVVDSKKVTFWSKGSFSNLTASFKNTANLVNSGAISLTNATFTFSNTAFATVYSSVSLVSSSWNFINNAYMEATGGTFSLAASSLSAGDGSTTSLAYIKFNGASLTMTDNTSFVTVANNNNYYFNWSAYSANGKSTKTSESKLNCGTIGKNACSSPNVYGPATLSAAGTSASATLPVKLSAFAVKVSGNAVNISWTTDQESNSSSFDVERSTDGINWSSIATVAAQGNSSVATKYTRTDVPVSAGTISYRLKMTDRDGAFEYSPIKTAKIVMADTHEMTIYPNPATDHVVISSKNAASSEVKVQLISMNGQVLKQVNAAAAKVNFSVNEFNAGNYIVRVSDASGNAQLFKLLVAK